MKGGEHGREVRDLERPRLPSIPIAGGPPITGQHPGRALAGGSGLPGQLRAEARRGDRHRRARRGAPGIVQLGEIGRQGHVVELAPVEPGVEPPKRPGVGPSGVRADSAEPIWRIPDFPVTRSHPPASWPSAANSSICRTYRKTAGEESRRRSPVANRWMRP